MIYIYTKDVEILKYLEDTISPAKSKYIEDIEQAKDDSCVIIDFNTCAKDLYSFLKKNYKKSIKIIVLDNKPKNDIAKILLSNGVRAYGNMYMLPIHLNSCLETVKNNQIWVYPEFIESIMSELNKEYNQEVKSSLTDILTDRQKELLDLLLKGFSNQEISDKLEISLHTTKVHISNIYKKLGVNNRISLSKLFIT